MSIRPLNFRPIYVYLIKTILGIIGLSILCSCNNPKPSHDVTFIERTPVIDGKLDAFLESLPSKEFTYI
ncbi:hypothetical protein ACFSTE_22115 [Aquimarina hainanensis]|uniref:Uncharacterized protein n=1 Tax=Aquimarina hainanensis TaxID=1578017 RepID=A0ABW5NGL1_9FLAO